MQESRFHAPSALRRPVWAVLLSLSLLTGACTGGGDDDNMGENLPSGSHLIRSKNYDKAPSLAGLANAQLLRYAMPAQKGGRTEANTLLFVPHGAPPPGGWPLVVWAHGSVGVSDDCAPSRRFDDSTERIIVEGLLSAGYAVLAPDYEGLDAPGPHPYLSLASQGRSITAAVQAAHEVSSVSLTKSWAVMGHSQGGFAALAATEHAPDIAGEYPLTITLALSPSADLASTAAELFQRTAELDARVQAGDEAAWDPLLEGAFGLAMNGTLLAHGMRAQNGGVKLDMLLEPSLLPVAKQALNDGNCNAFFDALETAMEQHLLSGGRASEFPSLRRDAFSQPLIRDLAARNLPGQQRLPTPVFYLQGAQDMQTPVQAARVQVGRMRGLGTDLQYVEIPDADHNSVVTSQMGRIMQTLARYHR